MRNLLTLVLLAAGCVPLSQGAIKQAAFDYRCPEERVAVTRLAPNQRSVDLDVCGTPRHYQDISPQDAQGADTWVETPGPGRVEVRTNRPPDAGP